MPLLFKWSPLLLRWPNSMLLLSIKAMLSGKDSLSILLTAWPFIQRSSSLNIMPEMEHLIPWPVIYLARRTILWTMSRGVSPVFCKSFVPMFNMTWSGSFFNNGFKKSNISDVVAPGKELIFTCLLLNMSQPFMSRRRESPATITSGFFLRSSPYLLDFSSGLLLLSSLVPPLRHYLTCSTCWPGFEDLPYFLYLAPGGLI